MFNKLLLQKTCGFSLISSSFLIFDKFQLILNYSESIFRYANLGIVIANADGVICDINPFACKILGYEQQELVGQKIEVLIPSHLEDTHRKHRQIYAQRPENREMGIGRHLFARHKEGYVISVEVSLSHFKTDDGKWMVMAYLADITLRVAQEELIRNKNEELSRITENLKILNNELEERVSDRTKVIKEAYLELEKSQIDLKEALKREKSLGELKSRFVTFASHEFKTPLSSIYSSSELIENYLQKGDEAAIKKHLYRIQNNVSQLNSLLSEFLSLGKIEEGRVILSYKKENLYESLAHWIKEMASIQKKNQHIKFSYTGPKMTVFDKNILRHCVLNLLSNAIKFSGEGTTIWLNAHVLDYECRIEVKDQGVGMSTEDQAHLFDRFFRGQNVTNIAGTGLGLHIVQKYIELLGGKISFVSKLGDGTSVQLIIPLYEMNEK